MAWALLGFNFQKVPELLRNYIHPERNNLRVSHLQSVLVLLMPDSSYASSFLFVGGNSCTVRSLIQLIEFVTE